MASGIVASPSRVTDPSASGRCDAARAPSHSGRTGSTKAKLEPVAADSSGTFLVEVSTGSWAFTQGGGSTSLDSPRAMLRWIPMVSMPSGIPLRPGVLLRAPFEHYLRLLLGAGSRWEGGGNGSAQIPRRSQASLRRLDDDLDGLALRGVGVGPAGDLVQVAADARDLPGALALNRGRRGGPRPRARHGLP